MTTTRTRRSPKEIIADLEAQIASIRERAERKKARTDPTLRHVTAAVRSIDKALASCEDAATRKGLDEARAGLSAILSLNGAVTGSRGKRDVIRPHRSASVEPAAVLKRIKAHPGSRCEDISAALEADSKQVGAILRALRAEGKVKTKGQARGMKNYPA